jgi:carbon monoxide dehydrogenase subunit G
VKIDGEFTLNAPRQKVWDALNDVETLGLMIPGAKGLREVAPDEYQATMDLGIGPIKTSFTGKVKIADRDEPSHYVLRVEGNSRHGWMNGTGSVDLEELADDSTLVKAVGDVHVGGMIARVGQRMIPGLAKQMMQTFFKNVEQHANKR